MEVWEKQDFETNKQYALFCKYRDLGYNRSLSKLTAELNKPKGYQRQLEDYSSRNNWVERAEAYDIYLEKETRKINERETAEMKKRHIRQALLLQKNVIARLQDIKPEELSPMACTKMFETAVKIERLSRDCEDESNKVEINNVVNAREKEVRIRLDRLTPEELEEYESLLNKMNDDTAE